MMNLSNIGDHPDFQYLVEMVRRLGTLVVESNHFRGSITEVGGKLLFKTSERVSNPASIYSEDTVTFAAQTNPHGFIESLWIEKGPITTRPPQFLAGKFTHEKIIQPLAAHFREQAAS